MKQISNQMILRDTNIMYVMNFECYYLCGIDIIKPAGHF